MMGVISMLAASAILNLAQAVTPAATLYRFGPAPHWVTPLVAEYDAKLPDGGVSDGTWHLLLDRQINVTTDGDDYYQHSAFKLTNANGVDERSQIDIAVDPTFQTLTLNSLRVVRQGRVIDQRSRARITALPEETELRSRIYNGSYNVNILLYDVRVGDVIEYEYTVHSRERFFPGQFSDRHAIAWSVPVRSEQLRIVAPADLALSYQADDHSTPASNVRGSVRELTWEWHDIRAIPGDDNRPGWYSPWPHVQVTTSKDWSDVARRVAPLFQLSGPRSPALQAVVKDIRGQGGSPADQALRALRFVQGQIRYVSISIGQGAFRPAAPEKVLERRFGDCKDKSLLLVAILRELGIEAHVALVHSSRGRGLDSFLPTPYAFDHAIVRIQLSDDTYWLDGTREEQLTPVTKNVVGDVERALVLDDATRGLAMVPRPGPDSGSKRSEVVIDLRAGVDKPAKLQITTFYTGTWADSQRHGLADESSVERQASYLKYIARYYPTAQAAAPITVRDDQTSNVVDVREYYEIERPVTKTGSERPSLFLQADEIYRYLDPAKISGVRHSPLAIGYPTQVEQTVRALLPWALKIENETVMIENPAFRYRDTVNYSTVEGVPQVTVAYRYESLSDSVDLPSLAKYTDDRRRAYDDAGFSIWPGTGPSTVKARFVKAEPRWPLAAAPLTVALLSLILAIGLAGRFIVRWNPPPAKSETGWPVGIRGWLVLPAAVVILSVLAGLTALFNWTRYLQVDQWSRLHKIVPEPWAPQLMLVLTACGVCLVVAQILLVYLFFAKRSSAPYVFIMIQWAGFLYSAVLVFFPVETPLDVRLSGQLIGGVLRAGIYTAYMLLSKRVKATFVTRLAERPAELVPAAVPP
jgi:transglutaminase-like putative cysteine protease